MPAPLYQGMKHGWIVRFEEITRCPLEVQDSLLSMLSDRVLAVPELDGPEGMVFAREGFNIIATANTRDRGVNEMSAALKRRFNFETVFPIANFDEEMALVREESARQLARVGVEQVPGDDVLEVLVTTFRELREGRALDGTPIESLKSTALSTAEAVSVACAAAVHAHFLGDGATTVADLALCLGGAAVKDDAEDLARLRRYLDHHVAHVDKPNFRAFYKARHRLAE